MRKQRYSSERKRANAVSKLLGILASLGQRQTSRRRKQRYREIVPC
jgi:hypothetical protein